MPRTHPRPTESEFQGVSISTYFLSAGESNWHPDLRFTAVKLSLPRAVVWSHHFMGNRWGNGRNSVRLYFWGAPKSLQMVTAAMKLKDAYSLEAKL